MTSEAIGVSQAKVCKYEIGALDVSPDDLLSVARVLNYSTRMFEQADRIYDPSSSLLFYRKRVAVPVKVQRRIVAEINIRKMQVAQLVRAATVDTEHELPSIPPEEYGGNPRRVAQRIREIWKLPFGPVHDLTQVVEEFGGIVVMMDFCTKLVDGTHLFVSSLPRIFFMNDRVSGERYRVRGHDLCHRTLPQSLEKRLSRPTYDANLVDSSVFDCPIVANCLWSSSPGESRSLDPHTFKG